MEEVLNTTNANPKVIGEVCQLDEQEKIFESLLKLWIDNKIPYDKLIESLPDSYLSKWKKLLRTLFNYS